MKKIFVLMFVLSAVAFGQTSNASDAIVRKDTNGVYRAVLLNRTYRSTTLDTSIVYQAVDWKNIFVTVQSKDSARCRISYQLSADGTTWGVATTKDSLSTTSSVGDLKTVNITDQILGSPYFRLIFNFTITGIPQGTTTNTYTAILTKKNY